MFVDNQDEYKVLLPRWIWEKSESKERFQKLVLQYMNRYPHYDIKRVENGFAVCIRNNKVGE